MSIFSNEESERKMMAFHEIEQKLDRLSITMSRELSRFDGTSLENQIKQINFNIKDGGQMPEQAFGRKVFLTLEQVFALGMGSILRAVVLSNYPLDVYGDRKNEEIYDLSVVVKKARRDLTIETQPVEAYFEKKYKLVLEEELARLLLEERLRTNDEAAELPKSEITSLKTKLESERNREFVAKTDAYELYVQKNQELTFQEEDLAEKKARLQKVVSMIEGLKGALVLMTTKLKECVNFHGIVKGKLGMMAVLDATGESIDNPWETNNIAGLYQHLTSHYKKASLVKFNDDFGALMKVNFPKEEVLRYPLNVVSEMDKFVFEWNNMGYWEFMSKDVFFTNLLLCKIPTSLLKEKCTSHVNGEIKRLERERETAHFSDGKSVGSSAGEEYMHLYLSLSAYIKEQQDSTQHRSFENTSSNLSHGGAKGGAKGVFGAKGGFGAKAGFGGNVETAAAAVALDERNLARGPYTGEITRDRGLVVRSVKTGSLHPYTATSQKCPDCYPPVGPAVQRHEPRCFEGACDKCKLHGHKSVDCQHPKK